MRKYRARLAALEGRLNPEKEVVRVYITVPRPSYPRDAVACPEHPGCLVVASGAYETHFCTNFTDRAPRSS
jgi:hypothetical protein